MSAEMMSAKMMSAPELETPVTGMVDHVLNVGNVLQSLNLEQMAPRVCGKCGRRHNGRCSGR